MISPRPLDEATIERARRAHAPARRAPGRPARPARRQPRRRAAPGASSPSASAPSACARRTDAVLDYAERRTRACLAALPDGELHGRGRARGARGRPGAARAGDGRRRAADAGLRRQRRPARGQPQLPARGDPLGLPVRGARADRPGHPADGRRLPPDRGARPRGLACSTPAPAPRSRRATSRPPRAWPTSCSAPSAARSGSGHDEQPDARQRALLLLRDARRRPGRVRGRRRAERGARRDEQHAQHARSRRSSASSRCASPSTRCAAAPAAPGATAAATASCASSRRSSRMTFSLIAERRRHRPARRRRRRARRARARPARRASAARRRPPARCAPASGCASKRPVEEDSGCPRTSAERSGSASSASGSWARAWRRTSPAAGFPLAVWTHTPGKAERWAPSTAPRAFATPAEVGARTATSS